MINRTMLATVALIAAGAVLGWASATGHVTLSRDSVMLLGGSGPVPVAGYGPGVLV